MVTVLLIILIVILIIHSTWDLINKYKNEKQRKSLADKVYEKLIERAVKYEEPVILNVSTDRLVDKVVDEIERRQKTKERML